MGRRDFQTWVGVKLISFAAVFWDVTQRSPKALRDIKKTAVKET